MTRCAVCHLPADWLNEADECSECAEERMAKEAAYWRPLYEGEKRAGLTQEYEADLVAAGRGHLLRRIPDGY